ASYWRAIDRFTSNASNVRPFRVAAGEGAIRVLRACPHRGRPHTPAKPQLARGGGVGLALPPQESRGAGGGGRLREATMSGADIRDKVKNGKHLGRDDYMRWQQALGKRSWLVYTWPKKYGGPGFTPAERYIFENVCAEEYAPGIIPFGTKMVGPVIYTFGSDE